MDIYVNYKQNKLTFLTLLREKLVTLGIEYEGWSPKQVNVFSFMKTLWKLNKLWKPMSAWAKHEIFNLDMETHTNNILRNLC